MCIYIKGHLELEIQLFWIFFFSSLPYSVTNSFGVWIFLTKHQSWHWQLVKVPTALLSFSAVSQVQEGQPAS